MPAHRLRRSGKSAERHRLVLGIEKTIKLGAAGFHARREFGLGDFLAPHQFGKLPRQYAFDRARGRIFIDAVLFQEVIEGRADSASPLFLRLPHVTSFLRLWANSRSPAGFFCVFLMNPCNSK